MRSRHLILGAHSLAGVALIAELIEQGCEVRYLVDGEQDGGARRWLRRAVEGLAPERPARQLDVGLARCRPVTTPYVASLEVDHVWDVTQLGHYADEPQAVCQATASTLALAARCEAQRLHFFSAAEAYADFDGLIEATTGDASTSEGTAADAAAAIGTVALEAAPAGPAFATTPSRVARIEAERQVLASRLPWARVLRTAMLLDPCAGPVPQPSGPYALLQLLERLHANVTEQIGDLLTRRPISILSSETASIELMSARDAASLAVATAEVADPVVHLAGASSALGEVLGTLTARVGLRGIRCVQDPALLNSIDRTVDKDVRTRPFRRHGRHRFALSVADGCTSDARQLLACLAGERTRCGPV